MYHYSFMQINFRYENAIINSTIPTMYSSVAVQSIDTPIAWSYQCLAASGALMRVLGCDDYHA
jgi:hypothetical protein